MSKVKHDAVKTLQDEASALLDHIDGNEMSKRNGRLAVHDKSLILRLAAKGTLTQAEIAKAVGCDQSTVSRIIRLIDTREEARTILQAGATQLAETVVQTDDAGLALKALQKLDVIRDDKAAADIPVSSWRPGLLTGSAFSLYFQGWKAGDIVTLLAMKIPVFPGQTERPDALAIHRLNGSPFDQDGGYSASEMWIPDDMDLSAIPDDVIIMDAAKPLILAHEAARLARKESSSGEH